MADTKLKEVASTKFLGVIINNKLTWEAHKQQVYNKVCKTLGLIYECQDIIMDKKKIIKMYKIFII